MFDRLIRAFLVVGGVSVASAWTWPGVFPEADPVAVLIRYHTSNVYRAVVAWYYVAPGVAVFLAGQFLISSARIWFARMGVRVGRRSRLPRWPLSPSADGPAIVVGEVHHPVRAIESPAPEWLTIPERGLCVIRTKWNADSGGSGTRNPEEVEYRFQEVEHEIREVERRIRRKWNIGSWDRERSSVA